MYTSVAAGVREGVKGTPVVGAGVPEEVKGAHVRVGG